MQNKIKRQPRLLAQQNSSMPNLNLTIVYHRIETLKLDPVKPRLHSNKQIRQIAHSMTTFGFIVPVLVDAELK